jgi:hypothetical protein
MRVELRVEQDEHEYAVTVECDRSVSHAAAIDAVVRCMVDLLGHEPE